MRKALLPDDISQQPCKWMDFHKLIKICIPELFHDVTIFGCCIQDTNRFKVMHLSISSKTNPPPQEQTRWKRLEGGKNPPPGQSLCTRNPPRGQNKEVKATSPGT